MTHDDFFLIQPLKKRYDLECVVENAKEILPKECNQFFKGGKYAENMPTVFITDRGRKKNDFMYGAPGLNLISERLKSKLESANVTGAEFVPVTIKTRGTRVFTDYYAMLVLGRAKCADRELSIPKFFAESERFSPMWHDVGYFFPLDSWDGSDIFYFEGSKWTIGVTKRIKEILEEYSGVLIRQCSTYCWVLNSIKFESRKDALDPNKKPRAIPHKDCATDAGI
jgi:hypothetical protein